MCIVIVIVIVITLNMLFRYQTIGDRKNDTLSCNVGSVCGYMEVVLYWLPRFRTVRLKKPRRLVLCKIWVVPVFEWCK